MALGPGGQDLVKLHWLLPAAALLASCGQKGPLYLPDQAGEIVTRPAQTPAPTPAAGESGGAPNSPQTVDSPPGQDSPAPEVVAPDAGEAEKKKQQDAAQPR
jgi:predicted small lipoprotein YifL